MTELLLTALAAYWLTMAVTQSDGPYLLFARARQRFTLLECVICIAIYASALVYAVYFIIPALVAIMAIAGLVTALNAFSYNGK